VLGGVSGGVRVCLPVLLGRGQDLQKVAVQLLGTQHHEFLRWAEVAPIRLAGHHHGGRQDPPRPELRVQLRKIREPPGDPPAVLPAAGVLVAVGPAFMAEDPQMKECGLAAKCNLLLLDGWFVHQHGKVPSLALPLASALRT